MDKKISELTELTTPQGDDLLAIVDDPSGTPETKKVTLENVFSLFSKEMVFNVKDYGAVGDGTTDDTTAFQNTIDALETSGSGVMFIPSGEYLLEEGLVITPMNLSGQMAISAYGAILNYTGDEDAILINTNIDTGDVQKGERTVHTFGIHIKGTSSGLSAIRLYGLCRGSFTDTVIEDFTSVTSGRASIILDARFNYWNEENHFNGLEIKNTGNGILFVSRNDFDSVSASCMNNVFTAGSIWVTQNNGKGLYGIGEGTTGLVQVARSVFNSLIIHPYEADNVIAFDFSSIYSNGVVFNAGGVDSFGECDNLVCFSYNLAEPILLNGFTAYPTDSITGWLTGGGRYLVLGGNTGSDFNVDASGNILAPTLTLLYDIYDANGNAFISQEANAGAVNSLLIGNATTGNAPYFTAKGTDTNIDLSFWGKGSGEINMYSTLNPYGGVAFTKGFINHGSNASATRPAGFDSVEWYGSVEPDNAITGDTWIES